MPKVYLSPSCQDKNTGWGPYNEEVVMNKVCDEVAKLLDINGIEWQRNNPGDTLTYVVQKANAYKPDLHVALHSNGFNKQTRGMEVWTNKTGVAAAEIMNKMLAQVVPAPNRGVKNGHLYETNKATHPTILIEYDFHDTEGGATFIMQNIELIAEATALGICEYLGVDYKYSAQEHWGEAAFKSLNTKGIEIHEKRFDDFVTRAEMFALLDRITK